MKRRLCILTLLAALLVAAPPLFACAACYGDAEAPMSKGLTWGITVLVAVVVVVLAGVVGFFVHCARKSAALNPQGASEPV